MIVKEELDQYYQNLQPLVRRLCFEGFFLPARWSYIEGKLSSANPLIFANNEKSKNAICQALDIIPKSTEYNFSFTSLMVERNSIFEIRLIGKKENLVLARIEEKGESRSQEIDKANATCLLSLFPDQNITNDIRKRLGGNLNSYFTNLLRPVGSPLKSLYIFGIEGPIEYAKVAGAVALGSLRELSEDEFKVIREHLRGLMSPYHIKEMDELKRHHALRSAIAAIMARNISHNIGSHVLANLVQDGWTPEDMKMFLQYMQQRMDFVAHISTSSPSWCLGTNFRELIKGFAGNTCLLDNIVKFQQLNLQHIEIELRIYQDETGSQPKGSIVWRWEDSQWSEKSQDFPLLSVDVPHGNVGMHALYSILENLLRNSARYGNREWLKSIKNQESRYDPCNGQNITAKLRFTINVYENWNDGGRKWSDEFYKVVITDHVPTNKEMEVKENDKKVRKETKNIIQGYIDEAIIRETGELEQKAWGMKEVKICASYLRLVRPEDMDRKYNEWKEGTGDKPPIIQVDWAETWTENYKVEENSKIIEKQIELGKLTYTLYFFKPKEAFIVSRKIKEEVGDNEESFRRWGIDLISDFKELRNKVESGDVLRHNFLVLEANQLTPEDWNWLSDHLSQMPYRIFIIGNVTRELNQDIEKAIRKTSVEFTGQVPIQDPIQLLNKLWEVWVNGKWGQFKICVRWWIFGQNWTHREILFLKNKEDQACGECLAFDHDGTGEGKVDRTNLYRDSAYHQAIKSGQPMATLLYEALEKAKNKNEEMLLYRIKEAAAVKVGVVDERIFQRRDEIKDFVEGSDKYGEQNSLKIKSLWEKRRVDILDIDPIVKDFYSFADSLEESTYDFFIIHQGLIDDARKPENTGPDRFEEGWKLLKQKVRWVIIDTGRGKPERAMQEGLRWIEYSNLAEYLINRAGDKYGLTRILFALQAEVSEVKGRE